MVILINFEFSSTIIGCQASKTAFRSHCARPTGRCASEAPCPNVQPRAHARLTGLTTLLGIGKVSNLSGRFSGCARGCKAAKFQVVG